MSAMGAGWNVIEEEVEKMENDVAARLDALESRIAVEELVNTYAQAFDKRDPELLDTIWFEDSELLMGELGEFRGLNEIREGAKGFWSEISHMHHWMANYLIEVDGDKAVASTPLDCFVTHNEEGPVQVGGLYIDECERRNGKWGIATRRFELHYWTPISNWVPKQGTEALSSSAA